VAQPLIKPAGAEPIVAELDQILRKISVAGAAGLAVDSPRV
jgi:hypothetical protein